MSSTFKTKAKYDATVTAKRFKRQQDHMNEELAWEWDVLDLLEKITFVLLEAFGVPNNQWPWYIRFIKRVWERAMKFDQATFLLEKTSLVNEYILRGHDAFILDVIQGPAEAYALYKKGFPMPPAWAYDDVIGAIWLTRHGYYDDVEGEPIFVAEPEETMGGYYDDR